MNSADPTLTVITPVTPIEITMKKTFKLTHPKIKVPQLVVAIKHEVRKYLRRERRKILPEKFDFWDFDCRFGDNEASSAVVHLSDINKSIDQAVSKQLKSFYLEILVKPGHRSKKPKRERVNEKDDS
jgi:hypothetical protein